jgi:hypothetical protein
MGSARLGSFEFPEAVQEAFPGIQIFENSCRLGTDIHLDDLDAQAVGIVSLAGGFSRKRPAMPTYNMYARWIQIVKKYFANPINSL